MKIIVIDDDPVILKVVEKLLDRRGHTVLTYASPLDCPLYEGNPCPFNTNESFPDVIITDYDMPRVNGIEFLQTVCKLGCTCANVAIITAKGVNESEMSRIARLGTRFFLKPIDSGELYAWIDRLIPTAEPSPCALPC
jgi:DNA-binding response OmpR family regulator